MMSRWIGSPAGSASPRSRRRAEAAGFTLLEILVAVTIATIALGAVLRLLSSGLAGAGRADSYEQAVLLARSKLDAMGGLLLQAHGGASGSEGRFRWQLATRRFEDPGAAYSRFYLVPYEVAVSVAWTEAGRPGSYTLRTIRLGPQ